MRLPIYSVPLPGGSSVEVSFDYFTTVYYAPRQRLHPTLHRPLEPPHRHFRRDFNQIHRQRHSRHILFTVFSLFGIAPELLFQMRPPKKYKLPRTVSDVVGVDELATKS